MSPAKIIDYIVVTTLHSVSECSRFKARWITQEAPRKVCFFAPADWEVCRLDDNMVSTNKEEWRGRNRLQIPALVRPLLVDRRLGFLFRSNDISDMLVKSSLRAAPELLIIV